MTNFIDPIAKLLGNWAAELNVYSATLRIIAAFIMAATIGCERARKRHSAGLRTFILVALSSSMAIILDIYVGIKLLGQSMVIISAATVIGIAIISSNSLLYSSKNQIKGLTTAVALWSISFVGLAVGATAVLVPEEPIDFEKDVIEKIRRARLNGFTHYMIVVAEGAGSAAEIAAKIKNAVDLDPRVTVLGHIQRGGSPTGRDRVNATKMGYLAVELLLAGKTNRVVCTNNGSFTDVDIEEGLCMQRGIQSMEVDVLAAMTGI